MSPILALTEARTSPSLALCYGRSCTIAGTRLPHVSLLNGLRHECRAIPEASQGLRAQGCTLVEMVGQAHGRHPQSVRRCAGAWVASG